MNNPTQHRSRIFGIRRRVAGATLALAIALVAAVVITGSAQAQTYTERVLHSFTGPDGADPVAALVLDAQGNLYGTTFQGGAYLSGTVFKVDTTGKETVLYSFFGTTGDGTHPIAGLVRDTYGNLYGTTYDGGDLACGGIGAGCGTVFKVDPTGKETVLYTFTGTPDGISPFAGLLQDAQGNLYGTTYWGGDPKCSLPPLNCGTVFKVDAAGKETVLYSFTGKSGQWPEAGLVRDALGNLYGTTYKGGVNNHGTVFKVDTTGKETVLHSFSGMGGDGAHPVAGLVQDALGNLYGTTYDGGDRDLACGLTTGCGTVFKLDTTGKITVLYTFSGKPDGKHPLGLVLNSQGNLYGTTYKGGARNRGTGFELDTTGKETVLYSFTETGGDGAYPAAGLVRDTYGNLYGTTGAGGDLTCVVGILSGCGTVFKLTPAP